MREICSTVPAAVCAPAMMLGLLARLFGYEKRKRHAPAVWVVWAAALLLQIGMLVLIQSAEAKRLATDICFTVCCIVLPYVLLRPQKKMTFVWFVLLICACVDYIEWLILQLLPVRGFVTEQWIYSAIYFVGALAVWCTIGSGRVRLVQFFPEYVPPLLCVVLFSAVFLAYYETPLREEFADLSRAADAIRMISVVLFIGSLAYLFARYDRILRCEKETQAQHALELRRYEELMEQNRDVRAFRHDFKNNLLAVSSLLQSGETQQAQAYVDDLSGALAQTRSRFLTGNLLADAILSDKASRAEERNIGIRFEGSIPASGISNRDLCTILTNAIDNAVEGCAACAPCAVRIVSSQKPGGWSLRVQNPVPERVVFRGGRVATRKADAKNHGFGLQNIRRAVRAYDGYTDITCDDSCFTLEVGLALK